MIGLPASSVRRFAADAAWPGCGRSACRSSAKTASVPSSPSTLIAAVMSAVVSSSRRSSSASTSMPSMPSVPLISARPSFSRSTTGVMPCAASASAASRSAPGGVAHPALAHQRQRAVRQRREVAGAAEAAVLVHHRGQAGVQQRGVRRHDLLAARRCGRWPGSTGAAASARGRPRARPRRRSRRRGCARGCAAAGPAARSGCAGWRGRRSRWRRRSAAPRRRPGPRSPRGYGATSASASGDSSTRAPCRATATTSANEGAPVPDDGRGGRRRCDGARWRAGGSCHPLQRAAAAAAHPSAAGCVSDLRQLGRAQRRRRRSGARRPAADRAAPRAGARRRDRPRPRACRARASTTCWRCCAGRASSTHLPEERRYGLGVAAFELGLGVHPPGAAAADRAAGPGPAGRRDHAQRPPRGAARARRALRRRGARGGPAAAGDRRRACGCRPT